MFKNTAQKLTVFAFADAGHASLDAGEPVTGDAANITCKVEQDDDGIRTAVADTNPTETEDGQYVFDVTAAECNGDKLTWYPESATAGVQVVAWPSSVIYTRPENYANFESALTNYSATRGLAGTALPAAAADAAGGLPVSDGGGLDLDNILDEAISSRSSHSAADVWTNGTRTLSAFSFEVTVGTNNDKSGYGLSTSERTSTAAAIEAAIINDLDGQAVMQAIADLIADDMTTGDLSVAAIATATRNLILGGDASAIVMSSGAVSNVGTVATNTDMVTPAAIADAVWDEPFVDHNSTSTTFGYVVHNSLWDVTGSLSRVLEDTDELQTNQGQWATATGFSTFNAASDNVIVNDLTAAALAKFLTEDTGETVAADGSVGKIAQGSAGGNVTVGDIVGSALAKFASIDTGETTAVDGSVAKLSQGSGGGSGTVVVGSFDSAALNQLAAIKVYLTSPYSQTTRTLTLVKGADYTATSLIGPVQFEVVTAGAADGDAVVFRARDDAQNTIEQTGAIADVSGTLYAQIPLAASATQNLDASPDWTFNLFHVNGSGEESPLLAGQSMVVIDDVS